MPLPALGPYELGARLASVGRTYKLSDLEVRVDDNHATGSLELAIDGPKARVAAKLSADELDLDDWVSWLESLKAQKGDTEPESLVLPSFTVPVERLRRTELRAELEVSKIKARGADFGNIRANVQAANGRLVMVPLTASMAGGEISATLQVDATADTPSLLAQLSVSQLDYGRWLKALQVTDKVEGVVDLELTLTGRGATLRDMLADADGAVLLVSGPARFSGGGLELWGTGLTTGLMAMTTMALGVERSTPFNCMVWPINVVHGVARSEAILMDTPKIAVTGSGTLNLATEEVDLLLRPARKKASLFSFDNPVRVTGTLANPQTAAVGKLQAVVRLLLPFVNPAFLLLSADIGTGGGNRCVQALADADAKAEAANKETNVRGEARNLLRKLQRPMRPSSR
jgi:AsmA family protein